MEVFNREIQGADADGPCNLANKVINNLVRKSFGSQYSGDFNATYYEWSCDLEIHRREKLDLIGRKFLFGKIIGKFNSDIGLDLSVLSVPRYLERANKYAFLYERQFGIKAIIRIVDKISAGGVNFC